MGYRGVYSDVLWWVGGFSLDVRSHHVQTILKINSSFSGASLVCSWLSTIQGLLVHFYWLYVAAIKVF